VLKSPGITIELRAAPIVSESPKIGQRGPCLFNMTKMVICHRSESPRLHGILIDRLALKERRVRPKQEELSDLGCGGPLSLALPSFQEREALGIAADPVEGNGKPDAPVAVLRTAALIRSASRKAT
jgi:hypothetical protein